MALLSAVSGGYLAGRKSVKPVYQDTFYATIEEIRDSSILVQIQYLGDELDHAPAGRQVQ